jgi:hypothetical protein
MEGIMSKLKYKICKIIYNYNKDSESNCVDEKPSNSLIHSKKIFSIFAN